MHAPYQSAKVETAATFRGQGGKPTARGSSMMVATAAVFDRPSSPCFGFVRQGIRHSIEVSYLEIYNETVRDLLNPSAVFKMNGGGAGEATSGGGVHAGGGLRIREDPRCEHHRSSRPSPRDSSVVVGLTLAHGGG